MAPKSKWSHAGRRGTIVTTAIGLTCHVNHSSPIWVSPTIKVMFSWPAVPKSLFNTVARCSISLVFGNNCPIIN
jgi:hypothetical protein